MSMLLSVSFFSQGLQHLRLLLSLLDFVLDRIDHCHGILRRLDKSQAGFRPKPQPFPGLHEEFSVYRGFRV